MMLIKNLILGLVSSVLVTGFTYAQVIDQPENSPAQWRHTLEDTGDILQLALPISAGIMTLIEKDYQGTKQFALSYGTTLAVTYALKYTVKKQRPEGRDNYDAFPSGHSSSAFSGASFIQRRYGWKYGKYAYLLATVVAISRVEGAGHYHDYLDVLAGAAVGIGSTYIFTKPYEQQKVEMGFASDGKNYLLSFRLRF